MFFYAYKVKYYDEKEIVEQGFVCAETYSDAMIKITAYYEEESIVDITLALIDTPEYMLPTSVSTFEAVMTEL